MPIPFSFWFSLCGRVEEPPHENSHQLLHSQSLSGWRACDDHLPSCHTGGWHHGDLVLWTAPLQGDSLPTGNSFLCFLAQSETTKKIFNHSPNVWWINGWIKKEMYFSRNVQTYGRLCLRFLKTQVEVWIKLKQQNCQIILQYSINIWLLKFLTHLF